MIIYQPTDPNNPLQDIAYEYDLVGNILAIHDRTPGCGTQDQPDRDRLDRKFSYDPLYRLLDATGRQCDTLPSETPGQPWNDKTCCKDLKRTKGYSEKYEYDPVGNISSIKHNGGSTGFTRTFTFINGGDCLNTMTINGYTYSYTYDGSGNLTKENEFRHFDWDHSDRMLDYRYQRDGDEPTAYVYCMYDSQGNRVKKFVRNQGASVEVIVYIDGVFEHCQHLNGTGITIEEDNTLHVMDNQKRIALVRVGKFSDDNTPAVKYQMGDHLGSVIMQIDKGGAVIDYEEYTPYGETSFGGSTRKRYRFTGKERDRESGLYYHGARYYAPWLGRWVSCDPIGIIEGINVYSYVRNNPMLHIDPSGRGETDPIHAVPSTAPVMRFPPMEIVGNLPLESPPIVRAEEGSKIDWRVEESSVIPLYRPEFKESEPAIEVTKKVVKAANLANDVLELAHLPHLSYPLGLVLDVPGFGIDVREHNYIGAGIGSLKISAGLLEKLEMEQAILYGKAGKVFRSVRSPFGAGWAWTRSSGRTGRALAPVSARAARARAIAKMAGTVSKWTTKVGVILELLESEEAGDPREHMNLVWGRIEEGTASEFDLLEGLNELTDVLIEQTEELGSFYRWASHHPSTTTPFRAMNVGGWRVQ